MNFRRKPRLEITASHDEAIDHSVFLTSLSQFG